MRDDHTSPDQSCCLRMGVFRGGYYQPLFDHMAKEHSLTLVDSEMDEICHVIDRMRGEAEEVGDDYTGAEINEAVTLGELIARKGDKRSMVNEKSEGKEESSSKEVLRGLIVEISLCLADAVDSLIALDARHTQGKRVNLEKYIAQREGGGTMGEKKSSAKPVAKSKGKIGKSVKKK